MNNTEKALNVLTTQKGAIMSVMNFMLMLAIVVMTVAMMSTGMVTLIEVVLWNIQEMLSTHMKPLFIRLKTTVNQI